MKRLLIALTLALLVLPMAAWSMGDPNTNFDMDYTDGVAYGWTAYNMAGAGTWSEVAGREGGSAQSVSTSGGGESGIYGQFDTMAGFEYTISVWMKSSWAGSAGALAVDWTGGTNPGALSWDAWAYQSAADTWQQVSWTGTAVGDKVTVFLDAYSGGAQFDDLTGVNGSLPEPSGILALGTGLVGLVGMIRRRK